VGNRVPPKGTIVIVGDYCNVLEIVMFRNCNVLGIVPDISKRVEQPR